MKQNLSMITILSALLLSPIQAFCSEESPSQPESILDSPAAKFVTKTSCYLVEQSASAVVWAVKAGVNYATTPQQGQQQASIKTRSCSRNKLTADSDSDTSSVSSHSDSEDEDTVMIPLAGQQNQRFYRSQEELQKALTDNPNSAINKLNKTLQQNFEGPEAAQKDIQHMFGLLKESSSGSDKKPLTVTPIIADQYKKSQRELLIARIQTHADKLSKNKIEYEATTAQAEKKKAESITKAELKCTETEKKAKAKYDSQVGRSLATIKVISDNSAFINSSATTQEDHATYSPEVFKTPVAYAAFMAKQIKQESKHDSKKKK